MEQIFEQASRKKLRFAVQGVGILTVEDLWDLPLQSKTKPNLDTLAMGLHAQIKEAEGETSFVKPETNGVSEQLTLSFEIVKHIIGVKVAERDTAAAARDKAEKKQKLLGLLAQKQDEELTNLSIDEIKAKIAEL